MIKETTNYVIYDDESGIVEIFVTGGPLYRRIVKLQREYPTFVKPYTYALTDELLGLVATVPKSFLRRLLKGIKD